MTDVEPQHRRSRFAWPTTTEPATTPAGTHDHRLKSTPIGMAFLGLILLFLVNAGVVFYILVVKDARDAQQEEMQQEIRDSWCQALDGFPQDNYFLDPLREQYDCGPGRPIADFPPTVQRKLNGSPPVIAPEAPPGVESLPEDFDLPGGASPNVERAKPYYPTPGQAEPESTIPPPPGFPPPDPVQPSAPPLVDLKPATDLVCGLVDACP